MLIKVHVILSMVTWYVHVKVNSSFKQHLFRLNNRLSLSRNIVWPLHYRICGSLQFQADEVLTKSWPTCTYCLQTDHYRITNIVCLYFLKWVVFIVYLDISLQKCSNVPEVIFFFSSASVYSYFVVLVPSDCFLPLECSDRGFFSCCRGSEH